MVLSQKFIQEQLQNYIYIHFSHSDCNKMLSPILHYLVFSSFFLYKICLDSEAASESILVWLPILFEGKPSKIHCTLGKSYAHPESFKCTQQYQNVALKCE